MSDVARRAGVSTGTVSNVLNHSDRVKPGTVKKVHAAIKELGFVRNDAARQLKAGTSRTIGLIIPDASNPFFADLAKGAENLAIEKDFAVIVGNSSEDNGRESAYIDLFHKQRVRGVLISPVRGVNERISQLHQMGINAIIVDREADATICCSVSVDDVAGGRLASRHLLDQGRKHIAFVGGGPSVQQTVDRLQGVKQELINFPKARLSVFETNEMNVLAGRKVGVEIGKLPASERPNAVFCANDLVAVGVMQALLFENNIKIPEQIAMIGYDDIDFAKSTIVPLSSVRQPSPLLGSSAVELLISELRDVDHVHRQITFQPEIVIRESSSTSK